MKKSSYLKKWLEFILNAEKHNNNIDITNLKTTSEDKKLKKKRIGRNDNQISYQENENFNIKNLKTQFKRVCKNYFFKKKNNK